MIKFLKKILGITVLEKENRRLKAAMDIHRDFVNETLDELKEFIRVDADVGFRGNNTIIVTGLYHGKPFVNFWDLGDGEFERLMDHLRAMQKYALIRNIDAPPSFRGIFDL